jgi:hypothetical protein
MTLLGKEGSNRKDGSSRGIKLPSDSEDFEINSQKNEQK